MVGDQIDCIKDWLHSGNIADMGKKSGDRSGNWGGMSTADRERLKELERENRELKRTNEILRKVSAYFTQAELVYGRLQFAK